MAAVSTRGKKVTDENQANDLDQDVINLWWLLLRTRRAMRKARARELLPYGTGTDEASVLTAIKSIGYEATPAKISRWLLRESQSTSGLLTRMQKQGLVKKVKDLDRRNMVRVELTKKGEKLYSNTSKKGCIHKILSALSAKEHKELRVCLEKIQGMCLEEVRLPSKPPFPPYASI